jgi:hypothetical protein
MQTLPNEPKITFPNAFHCRAAFHFAAMIAFLTCGHILAAVPTPHPIPLFVRITLLSPDNHPWRVHIISHQPGGKSKSLYAGKATAEDAKTADFLPAAQSTEWIDLSDATTSAGATLRFLFETEPKLDQAGVKAKFEIASTAGDDSILRTITDHDPGNIIAIRIPPDPAKDKSQILSIREDTQRRLDEIKSFNLPESPRPRKLWCMIGFRSNGEFYTDPDIAKMDFEIARRLGMNGYWQQNGGQPGELRKMAQAAGLNRSTVYWRNVESPPRDKDLNATRLNWNDLETFFDKSYRDTIAATHKQHPDGMPEIIADLMDEPAGQNFDGPEYAREFTLYLQQQNLTPTFFNKPSWDNIKPIKLGWRVFFDIRDKLDLKDESVRRLFYWSAKFWNYATARLYALATRKVEEYSPNTGTRVNFGPPWWYDYGTLPRGIDAFEFGRLRSVTLGFNEDWVGAGNARVPLEINTLLIDWSRAAARPNRPLLGSYITRDSDRATVKLRTFAALAREAKIFDFYYYGPAYTFFDHWSDNASMVRGVAELTRELGAVDDILWEGRAPQARVALLYSQSWPVWKKDDTEQIEQVMSYLALLHASIPVDIVSDTEVADGRFAARNYQCLYVVNESIPSAAAAAIERWVKSGGHLWASGWAGMTDEYNTPTDRWNEMLGVKSRSWKSAGDLKRLGEQIKPDDWKRAIIGREVSLDNTAADIDFGDHADRALKSIRGVYGLGSFLLVPHTVGKDYMDAAKEKPSSLAKATLFPDDQHRAIFTDFALASGAQPPAVTSTNQILAFPLWTQTKGVILLANYAGHPADAVKVTFTSPLPITKAAALHAGPLPLTHPDPDHFQLTLPMNDVTDIITLE